MSVEQRVYGRRDRRWEGVSWQRILYESKVKRKRLRRKAYDSMRVRETFMALMAARHSSRAPTLSVIVKWMVVFPGTMVISVHLCKCAGVEADIVVS